MENWAQREATRENSSSLVALTTTVRMPVRIRSAMTAAWCGTSVSKWKWRWASWRGGIGGGGWTLPTEYTEDTERKPQDEVRGEGGGGGVRGKRAVEACGLVEPPPASGTCNLLGYTIGQAEIE